MQGPGESVFLVDPGFRLKPSRGNRLRGQRSRRKAHVAGVERGDAEVVGGEIGQVGGIQRLWVMVEAWISISVLWEATGLLVKPLR